MELGVIGLMGLFGYAAKKKAMPNPDTQSVYNRNYVELMQAQEAQLAAGKRIDPQALPDVWNLVYSPEQMRAIQQGSQFSMDSVYQSDASLQNIPDQLPGIPGIPNVGPQIRGRYGKGPNLDVDTGRQNAMSEPPRRKAVISLDHPTNRQSTWGAPMLPRDESRMSMLQSNLRTHELPTQTFTPERYVKDVNVLRQTRALEVPNYRVKPLIKYVDLPLPTGRAPFLARPEVGQTSNPLFDNNAINPEEMTRQMVAPNLAPPVPSFSVNDRIDGNITPFDHVNRQIHVPNVERGVAGVASPRPNPSTLITPDTPALQDHLQRNVIVREPEDPNAMQRGAHMVFPETGKERMMVQNIQTNGSAYPKQLTRHALTRDRVHVTRETAPYDVTLRSPSGTGQRPTTTRVNLATQAREIHDDTRVQAPLAAQTRPQMVPTRFLGTETRRM